MRYGTTSARALYLHVPFCAQKCRYCDFTSFATREEDPLMRRYVMMLQHQIDHLGGNGLLEECSTVYVGGGTPSMLGPWLGWLCETATRWCDVREVTCEANPESLTPEVLDVMAHNGVTRVSIGVQSLVDDELEALGRIHDAKRAHDAVALALDAGMDVSVDLMCGIPLQTEASWRETLDGVIAMGVGHVSVYPLQLEEGTPLERLVDDGVLEVPDDDEAAQMMETASDVLGAAGLARYEVASYARGNGCLHNRAYWTGQPYLGLGTSAASMLTRQGYERLRWAAPQLPELPVDAARVRFICKSGRGELVYYDSRFTGAMGEVRYEVEFLTYRQALAEDLMLGTRMSEGASPALIELAREAIGVEKVDAVVDRAITLGLARKASDGSLVPTHAGWLRGNELYGLLWDLAEDD
ncbi:MAG: coproporphyrinogen III oxidase family protein [Atopobiaceae bacterium]|nr:coproporphyrinogen III oxidase family protein [Atopobiaceae bacterium]